MATLVYQDLFAIYREERGSNALSTLPEGFDQSLETAIIELTKKSQTDPQALKELENTRKLAISIIQLRRQKIVLRAINTQEAKLLGANQREQDFYDKMLMVCAQQDGWLKKLIAPKIATVSPQPQAPTKKIKMLKDVPQYTAADGNSYGPYKEGEEVELVETEVKWMIEAKLARDFNSKEPTREETMKIKIITDIPSHRGLDSNTYGPFDPGQIVELPLEEANLLVSRKLAENC